MSQDSSDWAPSTAVWRSERWASSHRSALPRRSSARRRRGARPTPTVLQFLGIVLVLVGIVTLSREPSGVETRRIAAGAGLAVVAALGFGAFVVGLDAGSDESAPWAVVAARSASVAIALAAAALTSTSLRPPVQFIPALLAVGAFDTGANVCVAFATTKGSAGIVAVRARSTRS